MTGNPHGMNVANSDNQPPREEADRKAAAKFNKIFSANDFVPLQDLLNRMIPKILSEVATSMESEDDLIEGNGEEQWERIWDCVRPIVTAVIAKRSRRKVDERSLDIVTAAVCNEIVGLGPLEPLMSDDEISEIMVNGPDEIYIERHGKITAVPVQFRDAEHIMRIIYKIVSPLGKRLDHSSPMVDARLPDGSRVNAVTSPVSLRGPYITIRRFREQDIGLEDLIRFGSLNEPMAAFLKLAVAARLNIVVSGGTGSGKTTMLNILAGLSPLGDRIVTVEDAAELRIHRFRKGVCSLESRPRNMEGAGEIPIRDLVRNALRMRPDRVVVGEVRGEETLDMLQAMNTGHDGSFTTVHANSATDLLTRLETMVCMASAKLPLQAVREMIASAIQLVVHVTRLQDGTRRIMQIAEIAGLNEDGHISVTSLWSFRVSGTDDKGRIEGGFEFHGLTRLTRERIESRGLVCTTDPEEMSLHLSQTSSGHARQRRRRAIPSRRTRQNRRLSLVAVGRELRRIEDRRNDGRRVSAERRASEKVAFCDTRSLGERQDTSESNTIYLVKNDELGALIDSRRTQCGLGSQPWR